MRLHLSLRFAAALISVYQPCAWSQSFSILHSFTGQDGAYVDSTPIETSPGVLYGTAGSGGAFNCGTLFSLTTTGVFTKLHDFSPGVEGCGPQGRLLQASDGYLYGVTSAGANASTFGSVFRSDLLGNVTVLTTIPVAGYGLMIYPPIEGIDGNLYGVVDHNDSFYYRISPDGTFTILSYFDSLGEPGGPLTIANDGNFYGQTYTSVYRATPAGTLAPVYTFTGIDYLGVYGSLVQSYGGKLYGARPGGQYAMLYSVGLDGTGFTDKLLACNAQSSGLATADDQHLYFTSIYCGAHNEGILYRYNPSSGTIQQIHEFDASSYSPETPSAAVIQASDGVLYGTTLDSGSVNGGTVYAINLGLRKPPPEIRTFAPQTGEVGASVLIQGGYFLAASTVLFNGVAAPFAVDSSGFITATVPAGASTGPILIATPNGTVVSSIPFTVQ